MGLTTNVKILILGVAVPSTLGLLYLLIKSLIQDDDEEKLSQKHATSRQTVIEIPIPRKAVGSMIGRQGANIKKLQEASGAKMNFKDDSRGTDDGDRTMVIRGSVENAQTAECLVRKALADLPVLIQDEMLVPGYTLGRIIGRGGESVRQMSRSSNTKIFVDRTREGSRDQPRLITIIGTKEQIVIAKSLIQEKLDEEEEFRAKSAVSAANRERRNKTRDTKHNHVTPRYQEVSSLNEDWNTQPEGASRQLPGHRVVENTEFPRNRPYVEVYVSAIADPGTFWVQLVNTMALKLDEMSTEMTRYFQNEGQNLTIDKVKVGDLVAAPFENDDTWYRAKVMEIKGSELDLFYVDYGDSCYLDVSHCKTGSMDIISLPCQAVECRLAGLKPTKGEWTEAAFDSFEKLTHCAKWKVVIAKAETFSGSMPHVTLTDTNSEQDINVNEEMVRLGFAEYDNDSITREQA